MATDGQGMEQESGGDQWQLMVRQEIENYMGSMLGPGGIEGLMDFVVQQTVSKVLESLPPLQVDNDGIARTAARMVKAELMAETQRVAAPAGAAAAGNGAGRSDLPAGGSGWNGPPSTPGAGAAGQPEFSKPPDGYAYSSQPGYTPLRPGQQVRQAFVNDPLGWLNFAVEKGINAYKEVAEIKWRHSLSQDRLHLLREVQRTDPELLQLFTPHPWGPEFQRMMEQSYGAGLRAKVAHEPATWGAPYNPFGSGAKPTGEFGGGPDGRSRPLFGESVYTTGSAGPESGPTSRVTGVGTATDQALPATMAEMLAAGA